MNWFNKSRKLSIIPDKNLKKIWIPYAIQINDLQPAITLSKTYSKRKQAQKKKN